jgi:hypothetical protein
MIISQETNLYKQYNVYNQDSGESFTCLLVLSNPALDDYGTPIWNAVDSAIQSAVTANVPTGSITNTSTISVVSS